MSPSRLSLIAFFLAVIVFIAAVIIGASALPERIATHFDPTGNADGWMSRTTHVAGFLVLGLAMPGFIVGLIYAIRFFPSSTLNVPHTAHWRTPANYQLACAYLFNHALWLAALNTLFFAALHACIVHANTTTPPSLPSGALGLAVGVFFTGLSLWISFLIRFFYKRPDA
jgi:uncharacterized membrane protein